MMAKNTNAKANLATGKKIDPPVKDPVEVKGEEVVKIPDLLKKLAVAKTQGEKRLVRRKLRALGHKGGLGKKTVAPTVK